LAVTQNIMSSIFNSHLFDFYQGWLYVLAVGIAGGQLHKIYSDQIRTKCHKGRTAEPHCSFPD
jgi:hypothetical protein